MLSKKWLKIFSVVYVFLFIFTGFFLIAYSTTLLYRCHWYNSFIISDVYYPLITLIFIGVCVLFLSFLGWKGITREHRPHVLLFCGFIVVIFATELLICVWSAVICYKFPDETSNLMTFSFNYHKINTKETSHTKIWNRVQEELKCCGLNGPSEYNQTLPLTCCVTQKNSPTTCSSVHQHGCLENLEDYISTQILSSIFLCLAVAALQFVGILCTYSLANVMKPNPRVASAEVGIPLNGLNSSSDPPASPSSSSSPPPVGFVDPGKPVKATAPQVPLLKT